MRDGKVATLLIFILITSLMGSIYSTSDNLDKKTQNFDLLIEDFEFLSQKDVTWLNPDPWWMTTSLDSDRNGIHDSIQNATGLVNIGISFSREITEEDKTKLMNMGFEIVWN